MGMPVVELKDGGALEAYRELGAQLSVEGVAKLRELLDVGLRLFRSEAEGLAAGGTARHVVRLEPSDSLLEMLAAVRAGDTDLGAFVLAFRRSDAALHVGSPSASQLHHVASTMSR